MVKTFIYFLMLIVVLIFFIGIVLDFTNPLPTENTEEVGFIDDIALDRAILSPREIIAARLKPLQKIKPVVAWGGAILFALLLLVFVFSRFGGINLMVLARWREQDEFQQAHSVYRGRPRDREREVPRHNIDPDNP